MKNKTKKKALIKPLKIVPAPQLKEILVSYETAMGEAEKAISSGRHLIAEFQLTQIAQQLPKELQPKIRLLACYVQTGRAESAEILIAEILKQFPRSGRALGVIGWYYRALGSGDQSLAVLSRATALCPRDISLHYNLGLTHAALGQKPEAVDAFNRAIWLNPCFGSCYLERAIALKGQTDPKDLAAMLSQLDSGDMNDEDRGLLHLAIAWAYDKNDDEKQFHHLKSGKDLINKVNPWSESSMHALFTHITGFFDQEYRAMLDAVVGTNEQPIFIAAMPRSGTTLLEQILGTHSQLFPIGETGVIGFAVGEEKLRQGLVNEPFWTWGKRGYISRLNGFRQNFYSNAKVKSAGNRRIVDKSLDNFRQIGAILSMFPNARIIHLRRDPLDTILSMYQLFVRVDGNTPWRLPDLARHYSIYQAYMTHWKSIFPNNILTVSYENMVGDIEGFTREVLQFCQLPWEAQCLEFHKQGRTINTPSVMQVNQPVTDQAVANWKRYAEHLKPAADLLGIPVHV